MRFVSGAAAHQMSLKAMGPIMHAIGAGFGPNKRARLFSGGNVVTELATGFDVARFMVPDHGSGRAVPRMLAELLHSADRDLGDGTTRLAVLTHAMFREAVQAVEAGIDSRQLGHALRGIVESFASNLASQANSEPSLIAVARTAGADVELAGLIGKAAASVGAGGLIEVSKGGDVRPQLQFHDCFLLEAEPVLGEMAGCEFSNAYLLVANEIIDDFGHLVPLLEAFASHGKCLVILARDVTGLARQTLAVNRASPDLAVVAFRPRAVGQEAADVLEDVSIATSAELVCSLQGSSLSSLRPAMLGRAGGFRYSAGRIHLRNPAGSAEACTARNRALVAEANRKRLLSLDRERLVRRAAWLRRSFAELLLAQFGSRESETMLSQARRAVSSTMSALEGGTIVGGASSWARAVPDADSPEARAARRCLMAGIVSLHERIVYNRSGASGSTRDVLAAGAMLASLPVDVEIQDPLLLTTRIFERAASAAEAFLGGDAILTGR
ncbi:TCP-1/cpn60 chaperonin family protein [Mesorhizobium ventifaucium]|uniref:60 kDa chaperonin (Modular protein) n=1 Tax=Mesorhizobium ventifaucium TaxID=666020 RepID=A0ABM9DKE9_9HYPH|nr:TCP-1/cpn60 chaperonin family protein [Mesorhizobium ventifaucium]CAH2396532.1 60 kDa chaperonin (modular protein) [Mesorhizobium ventifaucium]